MTLVINLPGASVSKAQMVVFSSVVRATVPVTHWSIHVPGGHSVLPGLFRSALIEIACLGLFLEVAALGLLWQRS